MNEYGFLIAALTVGIFGIGLYKARPVLERWNRRLKSDLERMRQGN